MNLKNELVTKNLNIGDYYTISQFVDTLMSD